VEDSFGRFAGACAILAGAGSLIYAVFFFIIGRQAGDFGKSASWIVLALNGLFVSAAYVGLHQRLRGVSPGLALWGLLLGLVQSSAMMANGVYQAVFGRNPPADSLGRGLPSWVDPKGLGTFLIFGIASLVFARLILASGSLPRRLAYLGFLNAALLVILFFGNVFDSVPVILVAGGLTAVFITPAWWIWTGRTLLASPAE
jgi:hypothetical protein